MTRAGVFAGSVVLTVLAAPAPGEERCGCGVLPFEGSYGGPVSLTLVYTDGSGEACPTKLRVTGPRPGAPDVDATLTCLPGGERWVGVEDTPFGYFEWQIDAPQPSGPLAETSEIATPERYLPIAPGMRTASTIRVHLGLPPPLRAIGKRDRRFELSLGAAATAPACICARVAAELEFLEEMHAHYGDATLLEQARQGSLRGKSSTAEHWMDSDRKLHAFDAPQQGEYAYDDTVYNAYAGSFGEAAKPAAVAKAEEGPSSGLETTAYAQTHPIRCEVTLPPAEDVRKSCEPAIVLLAALRHEEQHAARCRALNEPPTFTIDGTTLNWKTGRDPVLGMLEHDGAIMPRSGYDAWSQNPANRSADEQASYAIEVGMLTDYLDAHCP